jgi:hypothetical protein
VSGSLFRRKANSIARRKIVLIWLESTHTSSRAQDKKLENAARRQPSTRSTLKHHLQTQDDFVEFVITKLGMRRAEI